MKQWLPVLAAVSLIALFLRLGFWQLSRAAEKAELFASFDGAANARPQPIRRVEDLDRLPRYQPVSVEGRFVDRGSVLLDNQTVNGRPGVHVMTPFQTTGGTVLVNRGWVSLPDRTHLPTVQAPTDLLRLEGVVALPPRVGLRLGEATLPKGGWPKLVTYLELDQLAAAIGQPLAQRIVLLAPQSEGGFARDWRPRVMTPERHQGYAVQWFALALAVAAVWWVVRGRRARV